MSTKTTVGVCYSLDEENYNMTEFGDVIDQLTSDSETSPIGATYWKAEAHPFSHSDVVDVDSFLEQCDERAYDEIGEVFGNNFSNVDDEAKKELEALLLAWCEKHIDLNYWTVRNSQEMKITEGDLS